MNTAWPALAIACALSATRLHAEPLLLETGKPLLLACTTHAVVVAPEAASTNGTFRITLEAKEQSGAVGLEEFTCSQASPSSATTLPSEKRKGTARKRGRA